MPGVISYNIIGVAERIRAFHFTHSMPGCVVVIPGIRRLMPGAKVCTEIVQVVVSRCA